MKKIFLIIFLILVSFPLISLGAGLVPCGGPGEQACQLCHFFVLFKNVVDFLLFRIVPVLAVLMIAIGGFMYIFAGQNATLLNRAKQTLTYTVVGLVIIFAAWLIVNLFFQLIGVENWTGLREGWWKIDCPI